MARLGGRVNTGNGNKATVVPITGRTMCGGMGILCTLDGTTKNHLGYADYTGFGGGIAAAGITTPFGFGGANGCQTDADAGLVLMGHRYYDTRIGRFLTQDPAHDGGNWYAYVGNNPVNKTDPLGLYADPFSMDGNPSQGAVEAQTRINGGQDGESYNVSVNGKYSYSFTLSSFGNASNTGWGLGLGVAGQFVAGGYNHFRNYGPTSTQAKNFVGSAGYQDVLHQIANGQKSGGVDTGTAALYTLLQFDNGTQAQLGAFEWQFTDPNNSNKGIDIVNNITFNSLAYHIPQGLNYLGVPNPMGYLGGNTQFPLQWGGGNFGTIHQKIHLNFP